MEKIKRAIEAARRERERLKSGGASANAITQPLDATLEARIRLLTPINELPRSYQDAIIRQGEVLNFDAGTTILAAGSRDEYLHYLLDGSVALRGGGAGQTITTASEISTYALDEAGKARRFSVSAAQDARIFRIRYAALDRESRLADTAPPPHPDEVVDIFDGDPDDWIVVTLRDGLFAHLPVETIHRVLARVVEIEVSAGDIIVEQGGQADYFYLLKAGSAAVSRRPAPDAVPIHLATIRPGGGFGEEALIANGRRNATVTMTADGVLMRLTREDFNGLIRDPLLSDITVEQAEARVVAGAVWLDVREADRYAVSSMPGAISLPLSLLRLQWRELDTEQSYVVYSENPSASAVAAFLLSSRGISAQYVNDFVNPALPEPQSSSPRHDPPPAPEVTIKSLDSAPAAPQRPAAAAPITGSGADETEIVPADPAFYADTQTGKGLQALVDRIHSDHEQIAGRASTDPTEATITGTADLELDETLFDFGFERLPDLSDGQPTDADRAQDPASATLDPIAKAFKELETTFRTQIRQAHAHERERLEKHVQTRIERIRARAREVIREKLIAARARDKARLAEAEQGLRERYEQLQRVANRITHQKAEIQRARRQIEQKLRAADGLQRELSSLGQTITEQMESLDALMPDDGMELSG